jgi:hypothetical protein
MCQELPLASAANQFSFVRDYSSIMSAAPDWLELPSEVIFDCAFQLPGGCHENTVVGACHCDANFLLRAD